MNRDLIGGICFGLVIGWVAGLVAATWLNERAFANAARYQRTGKTEPEKKVEVPAPRTAPSAEAAANRAISADMIANGADRLLAAAREAGVPMSRKEAERQAREMAESAMPLGGAH
jgi:hypothetical protein